MKFSNQQCQSVRKLVADQIRELEAGTLGRPGSRLPEQLIHVRLEMRPASHGAAETLPVAAVARLAGPPKIDGAIDEQAWQQATKVSIDREARTGETVKPATRVWLGYDDRALYVAFWCDEPRMDKLVAKTSGRDPDHIWEDDSIELFVDPTGERQQYAHFIVNTAGAVYDELGERPAWNSSAEIKVGKYKACWQCEMAIPWADLAAAGVARNDVMALNLCRNRYADPAAGWDHAAWSVTYSWYHVPERFGVALLEKGKIGLAAIELPTLFGKQMLRLALANHTGIHQMVRLQASVKYEGDQAGSPPEKLLVETSPGELTLASVPVPLTRPGKAYISLTFGPEGGQSRTATFAVVVPEPAGVPTRLLTLGKDRRLEAVVNLNVAPSSDTYMASATLVAAGQTQWRGSLDCSAGRSAYLEGRAEMPWVLAWLDLRLIRGGKEIWQTRLPVMPQFEAVAY
ncbi:MAG: hypothetical protein J7M26_03055 [Armatimonadetes bacterium]|nr:hypothetical protein [Armatimonadota bacterium]